MRSLRTAVRGELRAMRVACNVSLGRTAALKTAWLTEGGFAAPSAGLQLAAAIGFWAVACQAKYRSAYRMITLNQ